MRIHALDAVRGAAAFAVVLYHCLLVYPDVYAVIGPSPTTIYHSSQDWLPVFLLTVNPLRLLWAGREAVMVFFVLSGYVLSKSFLGQCSPSYSAFVFRRFFRLVLPCVAVLLPVAAVLALAGSLPQTDLSTVVQECWNEEVTPGLVARQMLLFHETYSLNPVLWTLDVEWRVSLIFPLLVLLAASGWLKTALVCLAGLVVVKAEKLVFGTSTLAMLRYLPFFMMGALLAQREGWVVPAIRGLAPGRRLMLWALCYFLLMFRWIAPLPGPLVSFTSDVAGSMGATLLIALILSSRRVQAALVRQPLAWLGRVSFSLYLVHVPVMMGMIHLGPEAMPLWLKLLVSVVLSLLLAGVVYHLVERPSIWLGRVVAQRLDRRPALA